MPTLADLRARLPELDGLDDESAVLAIQQAYYPSVPVEAVAQRLGYTPPKPKAEAGPAPSTNVTMELSPTWVVTRSLLAVGTSDLLLQRVYGQRARTVHLSRRTSRQVWPAVWRELSSTTANLDRFRCSRLRNTQLR